MNNFEDVYSVYPHESDFPYIKLDSLSVDDMVSILIESKKGYGIGAAWSPENLNPRKEGDGDFAEFCSIVESPSHMIAIRLDIFSNPIMQTFFNEPAEYIHVSVHGQKFVIYNPLTVVDAAHPTMVEDNVYPVLISKNVPVSGFFRVSGRKQFMLFFAEPVGGGVKKFFEESGMCGLTFNKRKVIDS